MSYFKALTLDDVKFPALYLDNEGRIIDCNAFVEKLSGYVKRELIGEHIELLIPEHLHKISFQRSQPSLAEAFTMVIKHRSGQFLTCTLSFSEVDNGYIVFIFNYQNYEQEPSQWTQKVISSIDEAFWEWNTAEDSMYYSSHFMFMLGYDKKAFTGSILFLKKFIHTSNFKEIYYQVKQHLMGDLPCINLSFPIKTKYGVTRWLKIVGKTFEYENDKPIKIFGSIKNITEHHQLVDQLKEQNNYLLLAESLNRSGHWRYDVIEKNLYWSSEIYHMHGVKVDSMDLSVDFAMSFFSVKEQIKVKNLIKKAIIKKRCFQHKSLITQKLGKQVKIECLAQIELDNNSNVIGVFGVLKDITETEELIEKLKLLAMVNHTIKVPIFFINENDDVVYQDLSPQAENESNVLFNYINFNFTDYLDFKLKAKEKGQIKQRNISFDKFNSVFNLSVTYEYDEGIYIWIVENVTDNFRKEQQQLISSRLALLGNTFGNVSHDINNVLGVALGAIEMLELKFLQGQQDISSYIDRVKNAIDKGKSVTERLLAFTKQPTVNVTNFDPIEEIKKNEYLFKQLLLSTIDFKLNLNNIICEINFPQGEFINILLNLVLNSQDAIREKGFIGIIEISANINELQHLEIHVKDSGIGIVKENLTKVFDPFYSSKLANKGNGIGLASVYSTIYKHNGSIQVSGDSDLGGAEFTLIFKINACSEKRSYKSERQSELNMIGKRVLILDDEVSIAEFVAMYLESKGMVTQYVVTKAQLVEVLENNAHIDIFITDMILPDISGREAVEFVKTKFPNVVIYSMSGYITEDDRYWAYPVLKKPFNSNELVGFLEKNSDFV